MRLLLPLLLVPASWTLAGWECLTENIPSDSIHLRGLWFIGDTGWVCARERSIYYTEDGAATFTRVDVPERCIDVQMLDTRRGFAISSIDSVDNVFRTTDGGQTWIPHGATGTNNQELSFPPGSDTGFTAGPDGVSARITPDTVERLPSVGDSVRFLSVCFPETPDEGWAVSDWYVWHFVDGNWRRVHQHGGRWNFGIWMANNDTGWSVDWRGDIWRTDDGENWYEQVNPDPIRRTLMSVHFLDADHGWIVGGSGRILSTCNGGATWELFLTGGDYDQFFEVFAVDTGTVYVTGDWGIFWKYVGGSGLEEGQAAAVPVRSVPAHVSDVLPLPGETDADLLDIAGRKALSLLPGENDIRSVSPGVYFVRREEDNSTTKVIIQR